MDPESWASDSPIKGQRHSSQKSKTSSAALGKSSANSSDATVQINQTYEQENISKPSSIKEQKMDKLPHKVVENKNDWKTYVPTVDGSYVPSEGSSQHSSIANTVDEEETAQLNRLSQWSQSVAPRLTAPVPVMLEEKKPTLPSKAHRIRYDNQIVSHLNVS